jgi:hypothetical protein
VDRVVSEERRTLKGVLLRSAPVGGVETGGGAPFSVMASSPQPSPPEEERGMIRGGGVSQGSPGRAGATLG